MCQCALQVNGIANGGGYDYYDEVDDLHAGEHYRGQSWVGSGLPPQGSQVGGVRRPKQQYAGEKDVIVSRTNGRRHETRMRRLGDSRDDDVDDTMVETRVKDEFVSKVLFLLFRSRHGAINGGFCICGQ